MWKPEGSEDSPAGNGVLTTLLLCQVFRPCLRRGFILVLLSAVGLFVSVTYSKGLVAWSSIFVVNPMIPKLFTGERIWRLGLGNNPPAILHGFSGIGYASQIGSQEKNDSPDSNLDTVTSQTLRDFGRTNDEVIGTQAGTSEIQEVLPEDIVVKPRIEVEERGASASDQTSSSASEIESSAPKIGAAEPASTESSESSPSNGGSAGGMSTSSSASEIESSEPKIGEAEPASTESSESSPSDGSSTGGMSTTSGEITGTTSGPPTPRTRRSGNATTYICDTAYCEMEGIQLSKIFNSGRDPCDNFYKFVCTDWQAMSNDSEPYDSADDALSGNMEEMVRIILDAKSPTEEMPVFNLWNACNENGTEDEDKLNATLASFGINLENKDVATLQDVLKAAGNLLFKLNTAPLISVELAVVPNNETTRMLAIGEADTILSSIDAADAASTKTLQEITCKFAKNIGLVTEESSQLCTDLVHVAVDLAQASYELKTTYDRMEKYTMVNYTNVSIFEPLFDMIDGVKNYTEDVSTILLKNPDQLEVLKTHFKTPTTLYSYLAFHTTIYLSPFFESKDYLWGVGIYLLTGRIRPQPVPKWRLCLRLVDRVLPGFLIVTYEKNDSTTPVFVDVMADVMAEEVRFAFIDEMMALERLDNWTRYVLTKKAQGVVVHSLFPARYAASVIVKAVTLKINTEIHWSKYSLEYFLRVSAFMSKDWTASLRHPLVDRRRGLSIFDADCHFNAQKNAVVLPLAFYNVSVPTTAKERMFHIPRIGPRITRCLFRATFGPNFFRPYDFFWTTNSSSKMESIASCFNDQYKNKNKDASKLTRIEANSGIVVAFEAYQDRLFSKQYFDMDYGLDALPNTTANQLFFVDYALSHCHRAEIDVTKKAMDPEERVNVPLMNSVEFSAAFQCAVGTPMNPAKKCSFWD